MVIALEATDGNDASYATRLFALMEKLFGDFIYSRGIFDLYMDLKIVSFLSNAVMKIENYSKVHVSDMMERCVIDLRRRSLVSRILKMLRYNEHHAFTVFFKVGSGVFSSPSPVQSYLFHRETADTTNATDYTDVINFKSIKDEKEAAKASEVAKGAETANKVEETNVTDTTDAKDQASSTSATSKSRGTTLSEEVDRTETRKWTLNAMRIMCDVSHREISHRT